MSYGSMRKFWRSIIQATGDNILFKIEYKKWLWKKPKKKRLIVEMYCLGYNQLEIAGTLLIGPLTIRRVLKEMRKSLEWNIKTNKLLQED